MKGMKNVGESVNVKKNGYSFIRNFIYLFLFN